VNTAEKFYLKHGYMHTTKPCVRNPKIKRKFNRSDDGYPMAKCIKK